ncbi:MAG TPA: hypothetical protein VFH88_06560, partial [Candidatus Krumholzibacteria bacterium]|nr:hypothetical protein [Candidatus Krumholzibacteria bacterium]
MARATQLWTQGFGDTGADEGRALVRDASDNFFVTGSFNGTLNFAGGSITSAGGADVFLVKFNTNGTLQWDRRYGSTGSDVGVDVALDAANNVIVVGSFTGAVDFGGGGLTSAGGTDIFVVKLNSGGTYQWSKTFGSTADDAALGLAVDPTGNIFVTGYVGGNVNFGGGTRAGLGGSDVFVVKLGSSGAHVWSRLAGGTGDDVGRGVAIGNGVVITGHFAGTANFGNGDLTSAGDTDIFLAAYDAAAGNPAWSHRYGGAGADAGYAIAMDASSNMAITGICSGSVDFGGGVRNGHGGLDLFIAMFSAGTHAWSVVLGGPGDDVGQSVAISDLNDVLVMGSFTQTADFGSGFGDTSAGGSDIFLADYSLSGSFQHSWTGGGTGDDSANDVVADGVLASSTGFFSNSVDLGGGSMTSAGGHDFYVLAHLPLFGGGGGGTPECSDGIDNDNDGCTDYPDDPGCSDANDDSENTASCRPECSDGIDNDGNGCADYPYDEGCSSADDPDESGGDCWTPSGSGVGSHVIPVTRTSSWSMDTALDNSAVRKNPGIWAAAAVNTTVLASFRFDAGASCTAQGWVTVDLTQQTGTYWHVDDMTQAQWAGASIGGMSFTPILGTKSLWMGANYPASNDYVLCSYRALPGYGNGWNQTWCTKSCLSVSGGASPDLDISFALKMDTEPSYDGLTIEYTDCSGQGWVPLDRFTGVDSTRVIASYPVGLTSVRVALHFTSSPSGSNQDGLYPGLGAMVDSLSVEDLSVEDFEWLPVGATESQDWTNCDSPAFGNYFALFKAGSAGYDDTCHDNLSCYWAAILGSTEFYACAVPSQPAQKVVPHNNAQGQYIANEIWSPWISVMGAVGNDLRLRYTVYRDLSLDGLVFTTWHVRTLDASGCPGAWQDRSLVYYGDGKDWAGVENALGSKVNLSTGSAIQVAIGVIDMCGAWCGVGGTGFCHSPAPYIDSVQVLRLNTLGPQWDVRDVDRFQDTFASDGTVFGTARADAAIDTRRMGNPSIVPGDSAVCMSVVDPKYAGLPGTLNASGLADDPNGSTFAGRDKTKKAVYMYAVVRPMGRAWMTGAPLSEGPGGPGNRYPFVGNVALNGMTWSKLRFDYTYVGSATDAGLGLGAQPRIDGRFNIDLNDNLFTPGDTILYFYSATSPDGTTYYSSNWGVSTNINDVAANPMEFTILPAGGWLRGGKVLYIDGADGTGDQTYFDGAFKTLGLSDMVDRYDVNGPSSGVGNRPASRVYNVVEQLSTNYDIIIWDCGPLAITLGDGTGYPEKTD